MVHGSLLADDFRAGRVFLLGDAAHRFPPVLALGLNSAVQDAYNLCWKIAAVLDGRAVPITRASGKKSIVLACYATNRRLGAALHLQAFSALSGSPGARTYYDALRASNIGHHAALRQLANRLVGILHGCLKTGTLYDEDTAWPHHRAETHAAAA